MVNHIIAIPELTARQLASVIGKIISIYLGLGPITRLAVVPLHGFVEDLVILLIAEVLNLLSFA